VDAVGLGSRQSASRLFKRQLGMTFSEFRNKARAEGTTPLVRTRRDDT
jgi:AraC-like DNA-binding protein